MQERLQREYREAHRQADADLQRELTGARARADAGEQLEGDEAGDGAPQRCGDGRVLGGAGGPRDQQDQQRDRGAPDERPVVDERALQGARGETLVRDQAAAEDARVGVREPVEAGGDQGRADGVQIGPEGFSPGTIQSPARLSQRRAPELGGRGGGSGGAGVSMR